MISPRCHEPVGTESLFRKHAPFVARLLARLGVAGDELDDAVQEVFLVVHRHGGYMPGPATPAGYLASIAVRVAASRRRRVRRSRERASAVAPDDVSALSGDPVRSLEAREELAGVQEALDHLDPDLRMTLVLAELEGESCKEIAAMMRVPVGTVYWRLHRARKTFRVAMGTPTAEGEGDAMQAARAQSLAVYDIAAGLSRLRGALHVGAAGAKAALFPAWLSAAGFAHPAVLSVVATVALLPGTPPSATSHEGAPATHAAVAARAAPELRLAPAPAFAPAFAPAPAPPRSFTISTPPPHSLDPAAGAKPPTDAMGEIQAVAAAEQLLANSPARALALVQGDAARFAGGYLEEERRYIAVVALFKLGRNDEARAQAARFVADYPDGPYSGRIRSVARGHGG